MVFYNPLNRIFDIVDSHDSHWEVICLRICLSHAKCRPPNLESLDFFPVPKHLAAIFDRDAQRCFYDLRALVPIDSGKEQSS